MREHLPGERRSQRDERRENVDVVLARSRSSAIARPTSLKFTRIAGGTAFVPNPGLLCCAWSVEAVGDHLSDVEARRLATTGAITISSGRSGDGRRRSTPPRRSCVKKRPLTLATGKARPGDPDSRRAIRGQGRARPAPSAGRDVAHVGEAARSLASASGRSSGCPLPEAAVDRDEEVRGVGRGQERRERRLGAPGGGEAPEAEAADQPDQDDEGEVAAPSGARRWRGTGSARHRAHVRSRTPILP